MRTILLAVAAVMAAGAAEAQIDLRAPNPSQGQYAAPYGAGPAVNNNNNARVAVSRPTGQEAAPTASVPPPNPDVPPAPGTAVFRLNGRVQTDLIAR